MPSAAPTLAHVGALLVLAHGDGSKPARRPTPRPSARATSPAAQTAGRPADDSLRVAFRLKDQFGTIYDAADYRGRRLYLVAAGSGGRAAATAWGTMLPRALAEAPGATPNAPPPAVLKVADLQAVPRLLRGFVRGRFPRARGDAVLLDWSGALAGRMGLDRNRCTVLAVSADGRPMLRAVTLSADTAEVAAFVRRAVLALAADVAAVP